VCRVKLRELGLEVELGVRDRRLGLGLGVRVEILPSAIMQPSS
jgi:hypothetical protein